MKTLTLTQPWASLVAIGAKTIETRSWHTSYRGPLAIHAASGFPRFAHETCLQEPFCNVLRSAGFTVPKNGPMKMIHHLPTGCIVAVSDLVDIYPTEATVFEFRALGVSLDSEHGFTGGQVSRFQLPPLEPELSFGDYSPGRFAWRLENIRALPEPIPAKGALGLWEWHKPERKKQMPNTVSNKEADA